MTNELLKRIAVLEYEVERLEKIIQDAIDYIKQERGIEVFPEPWIDKLQEEISNYEEELLNILEGGKHFNL